MAVMPRNPVTLTMTVPTALIQYPYLSCTQLVQGLVRNAVLEHQALLNARVMSEHSEQRLQQSIVLLS